MSPAMYKEIIWPAHKQTFDYATRQGLPVIVHSCGFVEPLVPGLIEAGMDCLQAMEVKAGMDMLRLCKQLRRPHRLLRRHRRARARSANDREAIDARTGDEDPARP